MYRTYFERGVISLFLGEPVYQFVMFYKTGRSASCFSIFEIDI